jgi:predicted amino acid-binding ACT domain protein
VIVSICSTFSRDTGIISFPRDFGGFLNIAPNQQIRVYGLKDQRQLLASVLSLTPRLVSHRVYTRNVKGALSAVSKVYAENNVNIVKSEVTTFGEICILEFIADFSSSISRLHELTESLLEERGQLVIEVSHPEVLAEFFPASLNLKDALQAVICPTMDNQKVMLKIPEDFFPYVGVDWQENSHVILTAWDQVSTISAQFLEARARSSRLRYH